jgi:hypothetical protein
MCASEAISSTVTASNPRSSNSRSATPSTSETIISERFALICAASDGVATSVVWSIRHCLPVGVSCRARVTAETAG